MKKILLSISLFVLAISVKAQFPITQNIGSGSTLVRVPTPGGFQASLIMRTFASTAAADLTPIAAYPGAIIYVTSNDKMYVRNAAANAWIEVGSGGGGGVSTASNGLTLVGSDVQQGGSFTGNTVVDGGGLYSFRYNTMNGFRVEAVSGDIALEGTGVDLVVNTGVGINTALPVSLLNVNRDAIGVTQSDAYGLLLSNSTAAALGAQQTSPGIVWQGNGWKTQAGGASMDVRWRADVLPKQQLSTPGASWQLSSSVNSGAYGLHLDLSVIGNLGLWRDNSIFQYGAVNNASLGSMINSSGSSGGGSYFFGTQPTSYTTGAGNSAFGNSALAGITSGNSNSAFGNGAAASVAGNSFNSAFGAAAMPLSTSFSNTAIGANSMLVATTGFQNTFVGAGSAEALTTGQENTGLGYDAGLNATTAIRNVWLGWNAKSGTDGYQNVMIGYTAGASLTAGNHDNIAIGHQSMFNASQKVDATNSIAIGTDAYTTKNNLAVFGSSSITETWLRGAVGIRTEAPTASALQVDVPTTTDAGENSGFVIKANSLTGGSAAHIETSSMTTGTLLMLQSSSTAIATNSEIFQISSSGINATNGVTAVGQRIVVLNTNATSGTNIGLDITASGATTNNLSLTLREPTSAGTNYTAFKTQSQASDIVYTLPSTVGASGTVLYDAAGNGTLSWTSATGIVPALTATRLAFGDVNNLLTSDASLTYEDALNSANRALKVGWAGDNYFTIDRDNNMSWFDSPSHDHKLGINVAAPAASLDILGTLRYVDGNQQNGYVLTSDADGDATWQAAAGGGITTVGAFNTSSTANVASISGSTITIHAADASNPGAATVNQITGSIGTGVDGQGGVVSIGSKGFITIPYNMTLTHWYVSSDISGSIQFDIKRGGTSIVGGGGNKPLLSSAISGNAAISGWTSATITAGDIIEWFVDSAVTCTNVTVTLKGFK